MIKKIGIVGRARVGKSLLCSRFCENSNLIRQHFASDGGDFTKINIQYVLNNHLSSEQQTIRFISPNSSLNGIRYPLTEEGLKDFEYQITHNNTFSKLSSENAGENKQLDPKLDVIEINSRPSQLATEIMGNRIQSLIITDTPGVSGNVEGLENINDADLYLFMMRSDNLSEYEKSVKKMEPIIGGARVLFIYNIRDEILDDIDYKETLNTTIKAMKDFESKLAILKTNSIIENSIELLNPIKSVIPMGNFHKKRVNFAEQKFNQELQSRLHNMLEKPLYKQEENALKTELQNQILDKGYIVEFTNKIIDDFHLINISDKPTYKNHYLHHESHDRVMSRDNYSTLYDVNFNKGILLSKLHEYFSKLSVNLNSYSNVPAQLQELIIKYTYSRLSLAIKKDCGHTLGHHFESNPPVTMWAQEAILAEEIISNSALINSSIYTSIFKKNGITSASWSSVKFCTIEHEEHGGFCKEKLNIIMNSDLNRVASTNSQELILNSYNLALFLLGKLATLKTIYDFLGISLNESKLLSGTIRATTTHN